MNFKKRKLAVVLKATEIFTDLVCENNLIREDDYYERYDTRNLDYYKEAYHILPENCDPRAKGIKIKDNKTVVQKFVNDLYLYDFKNKLIKDHPFLIFVSKIIASRLYCGVLQRISCDVESEIDKILNGCNYLSSTLKSFGGLFFADNADNYLKELIKELVIENLEKRRKAAKKRLNRQMSAPNFYLNF